MVVLTEEIRASVLLIHRRFLRFRIPDVVTDFVCADAFIQVAIRQKQPLAQFVVTEIATSASYFITCFIDCRYFKVSINNLGAFTVEYADFASLATAFASSSSVAPSARFLW